MRDYLDINNLGCWKQGGESGTQNFCSSRWNVVSTYLKTIFTLRFSG